MQTISAEAAKRKQSLKNLMKLSRKLDAKQEALEREIKRLLNRKRAIPELSDIDRLGNMAAEVAAANNDLTEGFLQESSNWALI